MSGDAGGAAGSAREVEEGGGEPGDPGGGEPGAPGADDPRVGDLLGTALGEGATPRAVLVGFPSDAGVIRNGGRPGASAGPAAVREALRTMTPDAARHEAMRGLLARTLDLGDVEVEGDLEADQERLAAALAPHLGAGRVAVVVGGGHETAWGHFLGHVRAGLRPAVLNVDAHPDVRPLVDGEGHSGSPFRQMLEHPSGACRGCRAVGLQPASVAREHLRWLEAAGGSWRWREGLDAEALEGEVAALDAPALVSLDLDAVDAAHAPGVSAPCTDGLGPGAWLAAAERAGAEPAVRSLDLVELNPRHDVDGRTARLAARTIWRFLRGLAVRGEAGADGRAPDGRAPDRGEP